MKVYADRLYYCKCGISWPHGNIRKQSLHGLDINSVRGYYFTYDYCCDSMKDAVRENFIKVGDNEAFSNDCNVNIFSCWNYSEGGILSKMKIQRCPFCPSKIEVVLKQIKNNEKT